MGDFAGRTNGNGGYYSDGSNVNTFTSLNTFLPDKMNATNVIVGTDTNVASMYSIATAHETSLGKLLVTDLSSEAFGVNNLGTIVGTSGGKGFVWDGTNGMQSLTNLLASQFSNWTITAASDINSSGQILAEGLLDGVSHAVVLTVPEPSGLVLRAIGLLALVSYGWRRRKAGRH